MVRVGNYNAKGGISSGVMGVEECKSKCLAEISCLAVDYNKQQRTCYLDTVAATGETMSECCERYIKDNCAGNVPRK